MNRTPPRAGGRLWLWGRRLIAAIVALALLIAVCLGGLVLFLQSDGGRRLVAEQITRMTFPSGLRIHIGRIEGSLFGVARLKALTLADPDGVFFTSPEVKVDWRPAQLRYQTLAIRQLGANTARLVRLPRLKGGPAGGGLSDLAIELDRFSVRQLHMGPGPSAPVAQPERSSSTASPGGRPAAVPVTRLLGRFALAKGRLRLTLDLASPAGDQIATRIDIDQEQDRFVAQGYGIVPDRGALAALADLPVPFTARLAGEGGWRSWQGHMRAQRGAEPLLHLALVARNGHYGFAGTLTPLAAPDLLGKSLVQSAIALNGGISEAGDRRFRLSVQAAMGASRFRAQGGVDLASGGFDHLNVAFQLPGAVPLGAMQVEGAQGVAQLSGPFARPGIKGHAVATRIGFPDRALVLDRPTLDFETSAFGGGQPLRIMAGVARIPGLPARLAAYAQNPKLTAALTRDSKSVWRSDDAVLQAGPARMAAALRYDPATSSAGGAGRLTLPRAPLPGLGVVDASAQFTGQLAHGQVAVTGQVAGVARHLDNQALFNLAGGLPRLATRFTFTSATGLLVPQLALQAPLVTLGGSARLSAKGGLDLSVAGTHQTYGPVQIAAYGAIGRPTLTLALARPLPAAGLKDVRLALVAQPTGYDWRATGQSRLGPFSGYGLLSLPQAANAPPHLGIGRLGIGGIAIKGGLTFETGGARGTLTLAGAGLAGALAMMPAPKGQRIDARLTARNAQLPGPPPIMIGTGAMDAVVLIGSGGITITGDAQAQNLVSGQMLLSSVTANARLNQGRGRISAHLAGPRGGGFAMDLGFGLEPQAAALTMKGTLARRPIGLTAPARIRFGVRGWSLAPAQLAFAGGAITLSARSHQGHMEGRAEIAGLPLGLTALYWPGAALGGQASGTIAFAMHPGDSLPQGTANLKIMGLTRSGVALNSTPVDLGINARFGAGGSALRAVAVSGGQTLGRAQAVLGAIPRHGGALNAPLNAQLRYHGPSDALWRSTGIETVDLSGPIAVALDISGSGAMPNVKGTIESRALRIESPGTGAVLTNTALAGQFNGNRLDIARFSATAGRGSLTGQASLAFDPATGAMVNARIQTDQAELFRRDELAAAISGPLSIRATGNRGTVMGDLTISHARFRLGRSQAVAQVPTVRVREINQPPQPAPPASATIEWTLAVKLRAPDGIAVDGMGLQSRWRANLNTGGTVANPRLTGTASLVDGAYEFGGRRFDLDRGVIRFDGEAPPDPQLDIRASARVDTLDASILIAGTATRPDISFASTPPLPRDELLARLLFGSAIDQLSAAEAVQLAASLSALSGSGNGLNPINTLRDAIGLDRLRILSADRTTGQGTAIAAGKSLGRHLYAEVITDGQGYSATRLEFQITRWLSLLSTVSTLGRESVSLRASKDY